MRAGTGRSVPSGIASTTLALVLVGIASPINRLLPQDSALARPIHRSRLENGLDVIVVASGAVPLATVLVAVRNGAFTQDSAEEGLAHLYEHILFRSYRGDATAFAREASRLHGRWNGATDEEVVYYFVTVPSNNVDDAIELMGQFIQDVRFSKSDLKEELPVVLDELHRDESDPEARLARRVERALWGSSWSRKDVSGDSTSLAGITLERLRATHARYYVPNNAALIVTGDVSYDHVVEQAQRRFRNWKRGPDPFADRLIAPVVARPASTVILLADDVPDVTIRVALPGPGVAADTASTYAADVLFALLDDPASAFQERLVDHGPFQYLEGSYRTRDRTGLIEFVGKTTPEQAEEALTLIVGELDELATLEGVDSGGLGIGKKDRQVQQVLTLERTATLAPQLAFWWGSASMDYYLSYSDRLAARSIVDLRRFARDYVETRPRVIGVLAPPTTIDQLAAWLARVMPPSKP
ncbi:MAG TPA: pitrilysin family protein [Gemmatimonadales bacterium]|nr:pitrilysin family protein [Gemmatimonadales bacterium]